MNRDYWLYNIYAPQGEEQIARRAAFYDWYQEHKNDEEPPSFKDLAKQFGTCHTNIVNWVRKLGGFPNRIDYAESVVRIAIRYLETVETAIASDLLNAGVPASRLSEVKRELRKRRPELFAKIKRPSGNGRRDAISNTQRRALIRDLFNENPQAGFAEVMAALNCCEETARTILKRRFAKRRDEIETFRRDNPNATVDAIAQRFEVNPEQVKAFIYKPSRQSLYLTTIENRRARVLDAYKENPGGGVKYIVEHTGLSYELATKYVKDLIEDGILQDDTLTTSPAALATAYRQWLDDWKKSPDEMQEVTRVDACYMYGIELDEVIRFEVRSGHSCAGAKASRVADIPRIKRTAKTLQESLDRKPTVGEVALAHPAPVDVVKKAIVERPDLLDVIDDTGSDNGAALACEGLFLEGAGSFDAPDYWIEEVRTRGGLGVNLTGAFWRRYFALWKLRHKGFEFRNGKWVK